MNYVAKIFSILKNQWIGFAWWLDSLALWFAIQISRAMIVVGVRNTKSREVLHISYAVNVPAHTVEILREYGCDADYLAINRSSHWDAYDYLFVQNRSRIIRHFKVLWWMWRHLAKYRVLHLHFVMTLSDDGWEIPLLKKSGCRIVAHFRGCEARSRKANMERYPKESICENCDYSPHICETEISARRRALARQHADLILLTTPDLLDFFPEGTHFPFFAPVESAIAGIRPQEEKWPKRERVRVVLASNHPGIEGVPMIRKAMDRLNAKGVPIEFVALQGLPHHEVLKAFADADLTIGKMKMGYYANAQIESMALGVPAITFVRDEFMTQELAESAFVFSRLDTLENDVYELLRAPERLQRKRENAQRDILTLHNNEELAQRLISMYEKLQDG